MATYSYPNESIVRLHAACDALWQQERERQAVQDKKTSSPTLPSAELSGTIHVRAGGRAGYVWARNQYVEPVRKSL
jgi:hypothetical protein